MKEAHVQFKVGDIATLRKPHPCGSRDWRIFHTGADISLRCLGCGRRLILARSELVRRLVSLKSGEKGEA